jgi:bifunctional DNA-binding transcriptional regulator/antitoxin component of YhaV-PrlF toxin-antitoxin module
MSNYRTNVGLRGRIAVPVHIQEQAGLAVGDPVIVSAAGPGIVVIMTPQAVKDVLRTGLDPGVAPFIALAGDSGHAPGEDR